MAISGISTNYSGRLRDICILNGINALNPEVQPSSLDFGRPSRFCAGVQKLCQRYIILLLTKAGSQVNHPELGTTFLTSLQSRNKTLSSVDVEHLFNVSNLDVLNVLRQYQAENPDLPLDEQIDTCIMDDFFIENDAAYFKLKLLTQSGTTITFLTPLPE